MILKIRDSNPGVLISKLPDSSIPFQKRNARN